GHASDHRVPEVRDDRDRLREGDRLEHESPVLVRLSGDLQPHQAQQGRHADPQGEVSGCDSGTSDVRGERAPEVTPSPADGEPITRETRWRTGPGRCTSTTYDRLADAQMRCIGMLGHGDKHYAGAMTWVNDPPADEETRRRSAEQERDALTAKLAAAEARVGSLVGGFRALLDRTHRMELGPSGDASVTYRGGWRDAARNASAAVVDCAPDLEYPMVHEEGAPVPSSPAEKCVQSCRWCGAPAGTPC